jgi:regulator of nucleoside diphosphate kinase
MTIRQSDLFVSARDAEALARMLGAHRRANPFEADASDALAELLFDAHLVPDAALPADRVSMDCTVSYVEEPSGTRRTVTLAHPDEADPAKGRICVLSPVGLALLGRRRGSVAAPVLPNGRQLGIRILEIQPRGEPLRPAA